MHPTEEILLSFASGEADLPRRALVEGHLGTCASCRGMIGEMTAPGAALLAGVGGSTPPAPLWERLRLRVESLGQPGAAGPAATASPELARLPLGAGVRGELPMLSAMRRVPWRWAFAPGAWYAELARDPWTRSALFIGHLPPGRSFPAHLHQAQEDLLVLAGGYEDTIGRHEAGEYGINPPGSSHRPVTEPDEECWSLIRLEKPNLFLGWRGRLQRLF